MFRGTTLAATVFERAILCTTSFFGIEPVAILPAVVNHVACMELIS